MCRNPKKHEENTIITCSRSGEISTVTPVPSIRPVAAGKVLRRYSSRFCNLQSCKIKKSSNMRHSLDNLHGTGREFFELSLQRANWYDIRNSIGFEFSLGSVLRYAFNPTQRSGFGEDVNEKITLANLVCYLIQHVRCSFVAFNS